MDNTKVILLVEDNPDDEDLTIRALAKNHIKNEVVVARDGVEALDYLFGSGTFAGRDPNHLPEVVLLDLKLPKVDGFEVLRRIRADTRTKLLPVVMLTSSLEESDLARSYAGGVNSYVRKPVDFVQFMEVVKQLGLLLAGRQQSPPPTQALSTKKNLRLLLVEDSEDDAFCSSGNCATPVSNSSPLASLGCRGMAAALEDEVWDVIVSDYRMPQFTGLAALKLMQERGLDLPFILVSGAIGEDIAVQAMKAGAHDYLLKGSLARLAPAVERELRDAEARRQRKRAEAALRESEEQLRLLNQQLESRVIERTSQLRAAVDSLPTEIAERQRLERQILEISECEKARVGQDLHDGLCQTLTGIALTAKLLQHNLEDEKVSLPAASADMKRIVGLIKEAMAEARSLALGMYPVNIEEYGLAHALEKLAEDLPSVIASSAISSATCPSYSRTTKWPRRLSHHPGGREQRL